MLLYGSVACFDQDGFELSRISQALCNDAILVFAFRGLLCGPRYRQINGAESQMPANPYQELECEAIPRNLSIEIR